MGIITEQLLQDMSRALTYLIFTKSIVEEMYIKGKCLDDEEFDRMERTVNHYANRYGLDWDRAETVRMFLK